MSDVNKPEEKEAPSFLEMSDEDILKMSAPPALTAPAEKSEQEDAPATSKEEEASDKEGDGDEEASESKDDESAGDSQAAKSDEADDANEVKPDEDEGKTKEPKAKAADTEDKETKEPATIDYKAEYERLTAPFKANGREIKVESVDDAIALMQMGANYTKKMAALKPNLKLLKTLENNGLLSEEKIGFLIDLTRKDPGAINKLVKESGIDPMELDAAKADAYKQKTYAVADTEIELDMVLDDLNGSETYTRTLDVVTNKWDAASKQVVAGNPQLLKVINDHMASGIYDLISNEVEREQMLGRLSGLSSIEAYRKVGDAINARGGFNHLVKPKVDASSQPPVVIPAKPKTPVDEEDRNTKRRAAAPSKPATPSAPLADVSPLGMSDEEFLKMPLPKLK